jgi:superfamily II DNA helicase RecQ
VIFHDSTLREMHTRRPRTLDELAAISGVGDRKLERYGDAFLDVFERWSESSHEPIHADPPRSPGRE